MSNCRGCNKKIVWGKTLEGKIIPLDPTPPVYRLTEGTDGIFIERASDSMVSHFATCTHANDFSGSKRKETV